jgi:hypothetical protein
VGAQQHRDDEAKPRGCTDALWRRFPQGYSRPRAMTDAEMLRAGRGRRVGRPSHRVRGICASIHKRGCSLAHRARRGAGYSKLLETSVLGKTRLPELRRVNPISGTGWARQRRTTGGQRAHTELRWVCGRRRGGHCIGGRDASRSRRIWETAFISYEPAEIRKGSYLRTGRSRFRLHGES